MADEGIDIDVRGVPDISTYGDEGLNVHILDSKLA